MLQSIPNPMGASPEIVAVGELAADFIVAVKEAVRQTKQERANLKNMAANDESGRQCRQLDANLAFLHGIVDASSRTLLSTWDDITATQAAPPPDLMRKKSDA